VTISAQAVAILMVQVCALHLGAVFVVLALIFVGSALEHSFLTRQSGHEHLRALADSEFSIPVSIVIPAFNEEVGIEAAVGSLLRQDYPHLEVIVVNDGSTDHTLDILRERFDLDRREVFYRRLFQTSPVRGIYRSRADGRLTVVDKENGGKADALNAGINLARFRYVCTVDADTVYYPGALLYAMRPALVDAEAVIGISCSVTISSRPECDVDCGVGAQRIDDRILANFQLLDYLRAFINSRLGWTRWNFMLCSVGAFAIWRRDAIEELGGFSTAFTCEDIEFTFRAHEKFRREKRRYLIIALPESAGRTEGPATIRRLVSQRARWQRVIAETVWHYRRMLLNPRYGSVGLVGMPYYLIVEVLAPVFQLLGVAAVPLAWWAGVLDLGNMVLLVITIALAAGTLSALAVLLQDRGARAYSASDLARLIVLGALDLVTYRPILMFAQAKGLIDFLRGDKRWNKFERNPRAPAHLQQS
jgi:cellulose synthase/poly-beta-1,6-N-acetylglucosamine synthase-like glycosyltransferase